MSDLNPEQSGSAAQEEQALPKANRPFKEAASSGLGGKKRFAMMVGAAGMVLAVGALTLSDVSSNMNDEPGQVALTAPEPAPQEPVVQAAVEPVQTPAGEVPMTLASLGEQQVQTKPLEMSAEQMAQVQPVPQPQPELTQVATVSNEELNAKIEALLAMTGELQTEIKSLKTQVGTVARNTKQVSAPRQAPQSMIALNILDVNPMRVIVNDGKERYVVRVGERLPGGAIFMGFDQESRSMKTDRGMVQIPS